MNQGIWPYILEAHRQGRKNWALLLDPDKAEDKDLGALLRLAENLGCALLLLGTSLQESNRSGEFLVRHIKQNSQLPLVLFPGPGNPIWPEADALLFLSLVSGRNPEFLIGQQVLAAPAVHRAGIETIPTAYSLIDGGNTTTAHYISQTLPIPANKPGIAAATALAAHYLGLKLHYLDAGSGALHPVAPQTIAAVKQLQLGPLWVGGGIRHAYQAKQAWDAGADFVVVGQAAEEQPQNLSSIFGDFRHNPST